MPASPLACRLTQRGALRITGKDRANFLQGLISNDIGLCKADQAIYAALLTPQGKFLHAFFAVDGGDAFLLDCEKAGADELLRKLNGYKLRADVKLENISDAWAVWALFSGEHGGAPLPACGLRHVRQLTET